MSSVLPRISRGVVAFYYAFSVVYPVILSSVTVAYICIIWEVVNLFNRWLIYLRGGYSRQVPTSVGRTLYEWMVIKIDSNFQQKNVCSKNTPMCITVLIELPKSVMHKQKKYGHYPASVFQT